MRIDDAGAYVTMNSCEFFDLDDAGSLATANIFAVDVNAGTCQAVASNLDTVDGTVDTF